MVVNFNGQEEGKYQGQGGIGDWPSCKKEKFSQHSEFTKTITTNNTTTVSKYEFTEKVTMSYYTFKICLKSVFFRTETNIPCTIHFTCINNA